MINNKAIMKTKTLEQLGFEKKVYLSENPLVTMDLKIGRYLFMSAIGNDFVSLFRDGDLLCKIKSSEQLENLIPLFKKNAKNNRKS